MKNQEIPCSSFQLLFVLIILIASLLLICPQAIFGQDPQFSQISNASQFLNPALTGSIRQSRFAYHTRLELNDIRTGYSAHAFTAEQNVLAKSSGLGLQFLHEKNGEQQLTWVNLGLSYAYYTRLNRKMRLAVGVKAAYSQRYFELSRLPLESFEEGQTSPAIRKVSFWDYDLGVALITRRYYVGFSIDHLSRPHYSFRPDQAPLPWKFSVHGEYKLPLKRTVNHRITQSLVSHLNLEQQGSWTQLNLGAYWQWYNFRLGAYYRGSTPRSSFYQNLVLPNAFVGLFGWEWEGLRMTYTVDFPLTQQDWETGVIHELAVQVSLPFLKKRRARSGRFIPCPRF